MLWRYGGVHWGGNYNDNGPKRRVSHRLGLRWVFFLFSSCFFFVFNDLHRYYGYSNGTVWFNAGNNNNNRPKRRVSRRLGPRWAFYFISFVYWYLMMHLGTTFRIQATARRRDPNDGVTVVWAPVSLHYRTPHPPPHPLTLTDRQWEDDKVRDEQWEVCFFRLLNNCTDN